MKKVGRAMQSFHFFSDIRDKDIMFSMEITRLIERCRQGDADALGALYKAYAQKMRGVCRRYVSDEQAISDVLHDAFVIIFTSFDKLRDDRKAEAWMMSITRNVASKYKDHLSKMTFVPLEEAEHLQISGGESEVRDVPWDDVQQFIDRLPEGYGQVFRLSVFEGMSHKEIADMLGIEPHSSSSQLARAKKMLRKMMQQYWVAVLLLLLMPLTFFLFKKKGAGEHQASKPVIAKQKDTPKQNTPTSASSEEHPQEPVVVHIPIHHTPIDTLQSVIAQALDSIMPDSLTNMVAQEQTDADTISGDTTAVIHNMVLPHDDIVDLFPEKSATDIENEKKWSVQLAYNSQFDEQSRYSQPFSFKPAPSAAQSTPGPLPTPIIPSSIDNWSDYAIYLSANPSAVSDKTRSVIMNIALNNAGDASGTGTDKIVRKSHHYMPINFSLALKYRLNNRFGIETGLSYNRLKSEFEMGSNGNTINEQQTVHYLGIPVKGFCNLYTNKAWTLYGSLGITIEIPVYSPLSTHYYLHGLLEATDKSTISAPWQWSVGIGLGLQYNLTPSIGFFAEPSLQYYIPTAASVETYHTERPFTFSLPLGIRFTW